MTDNKRAETNANDTNRDRDETEPQAILSTESPPGAIRGATFVDVTRAGRVSGFLLGPTSADKQL